MDDKTVKNRKSKVLYIVPYLVMLLMTPIYNILDRRVFVEVFGCGCVPIAQTNMLNIDFNANDLRRTVYTIIACLMLAWGIQISKTFKDRTAKVIYCVTIFVVNIVVMNYICRIYMWG